MALFDNSNVHYDSEALSYRESRNPEERNLIVLVSEEHKELLRLPANGSTTQISKLVRSHTKNLREHIEEAVRQRHLGNSFEKRIALHSARLEQVSWRAAIKLLQLKAFQDPLTKLNNRGAFDQNLSNLLTECINHKSSFALICLDAVFFKALNEIFGELIGDDVLHIIANSLRPTELVTLATMNASRTGGDEFAVLLSFKGVARNKQGSALANILKRLSDETNREITAFIERKIADNTITRDKLNDVIRSIYGNSEDLAPRMRLAGVLVTPRGQVHRYLVTKYSVSKVDNIYPCHKHCIPIVGETVSECCTEILNLVKQDVNLVKEYEKTGREICSLPPS